MRIHQGAPVRIRAVLAAVTTAAIAILMLPSPAQAAAAGVWRCSAQGNIPIGVLTVKSGGYTFQAVRDTVWAPKPQDSSNGSGKLTVKGSKITVKNGPLRTQMGVTTGFYGAASSVGSGSNEYLDLFNDPSAAYLLRCYRP